MSKNVAIVDAAAGVCVSSGKTTVADTAVPFTLVPPVGATWLRMQVDAADVRVTWDGTTAPVGGSVGELILAGSWIRVSVNEAARVQMIRNAGVSATIQWSWWSV